LEAGFWRRNPGSKGVMSSGAKWNDKAFSTKTKNKINFQMERPITYNKKSPPHKTRIYLIIRLIYFQEKQPQIFFQHLTTPRTLN